MDPTQNTNQPNTSGQVPPAPNQPVQPIQSTPPQTTDNFSGVPTPPTQPPMPEATPPENTPAHPKSNMPLILGIIAIVIILAVSGGIIVFSGQQPAPTTPIIPTVAVQEKPTETVSPTQTTEEEIESVDTEASDAAEVTQTQEDINSL